MLVCGFISSKFNYGLSRSFNLIIRLMELLWHIFNHTLVGHLGCSEIFYFVYFHNRFYFFYSFVWPVWFYSAIVKQLLLFGDMIIDSLVLFFFCLLGVIQLLHGEYDDKEVGTEDISKQAIRKAGMSLGLSVPERRNRRQWQEIATKVRVGEADANTCIMINILGDIFQCFRCPFSNYISVASLVLKFKTWSSLTLPSD